MCRAWAVKADWVCRNAAPPTKPRIALRMPPPELVAYRARVAPDLCARRGAQPRRYDRRVHGPTALKCINAADISAPPRARDYAGPGLSRISVNDISKAYKIH
ncbi:hypothetical protein GCM10007387_21530 [Pseudoduganella albidiflava]|uniref:Uncharacterized protein n=1 Tax=Pseudoduganella albidiflava TaxID=321983 RepID=A0AA88C2P3_9BURK|nr:hypothetical protein GCM10007387_21530 [Pseudoduganella albidiflava]